MTSMPRDTIASYLSELMLSSQSMRRMPRKTRTSATHADRLTGLLKPPPQSARTRTSHHLLKPRIPNASDALSNLEVVLSRVPSRLRLACIVDSILDDLSQGSPLLAKVDNDSDASTYGSGLCGR